MRVEDSLEIKQFRIDDFDDVVYKEPPNYSIDEDRLSSGLLS